MRIYLAGSITGKGIQEVFEYWDKTKTMFEDMGYQVFTPMMGKGHYRTAKKSERFDKASGYTNPISTDHAIVARDKWMCTQMVDIVYANLTTSGDKVSIGSCMEIAWASQAGKQVIISMPKGNIHEHAFILESATIVFETHEEAVEYLGQIIVK